MSAFLLSDKHLSTLAAAIYANCDGLGNDKPEQIAQALLDENIHGLIARYGLRDASQWHKLDYQPLPLSEIEPEALLVMLSSYEYQAWEHDGWLKSQAHSLIDSLRTKLIQKITDPYSQDFWSI